MPEPSLPELSECAPSALPPPHSIVGDAGRERTRSRPAAVRLRQRPGARPPAALPPDLEVLRRRGVCDALLQVVLRTARRRAMPPGRLLLDLELVPEEAYYAAVAEAAGLRFLPSGSFVSCHSPGFPPPPGTNGPLAIGRDESGRTMVAVALPPGRLAAFLDLVDRFPDLRERTCIAAPAALDRAIAEADPAARLALTRSRMSALRTLTKGQAVVLAVAAGGILAGQVFSLKAAAVLLSVLVTGVGLLSSGVRALAGVSGARAPVPHRMLPRAELPPVSVLVPLYREARVAASLAAHLGALDYPRDRFEVLFLLEADDRETGAALVPHLRGGMRILSVPNGHPRTKPRALAHGLSQARGELVVVYDGEDRPEPDQLLKAAARFAELPADVAVLQAQLAIDHRSPRFFPRQFLMEYSGLFDCLLPWMAARDWPVPLGGTSNHFRRLPLEAVGGWDPHNVTEDADLAVRLVRSGYGIAMLGSTTWEEAPLSWIAWHRQRTRWLKGWLQTLLVLLRSPGALARDLRRTRLVVLLVYLLAMVTTLAAHPVFVLVLLFYGTGLADVSLLSVDFAAILLPLAGLSVLACYGGMTLLLIGGAMARDRPPALLDLLLVPVYWIAQSLAFYAALMELVRAPHHWQKTEHGLARRPRTGGVAMMAPARGWRVFGFLRARRERGGPRGGGELKAPRVSV